jgi:hypothetical protein
MCHCALGFLTGGVSAWRGGKWRCPFDDVLLLVQAKAVLNLASVGQTTIFFPSQINPVQLTAL